MDLVTVSGVSPRLNGWQFIGAIDVMSDEENNFVGNLLRSIPGVEMPETFRTERMHCDHCNLWKNWKSTFIVRHDDGTHKQVGRQCLKDFTGHKSPEMLVRLAELLMNVGKLFSDAEDDEWEGGVIAEEASACAATSFASPYVDSTALQGVAGPELSWSAFARDHFANSPTSANVRCSPVGCVN
jgi:hypothetical protein